MKITSLITLFMFIVLLSRSQTDTMAVNLNQTDSLRIIDTTLTIDEVMFSDSIARVNRETEILKQSQE
ncbi:MAG: hypothetical protein B6D61_13580, partial [Bacteroidetes bacterium 4484_249]